MLCQNAKTLSAVSSFNSPTELFLCTTSVVLEGQKGPKMSKCFFTTANLAEETMGATYMWSDSHTSLYSSVNLLLAVSHVSNAVASQQKSLLL